MATGKLTPRQERFVQEYLKDLNGTQAAIRAGYSEKTANEQGSRLLANVSVAEAVKEAQDARAARVAITQDYVLMMLRRNLERSMQAEAVVDKEGNATGEYRYEGAVANGAIKLMGQHLGMFSDRTEHSGKVEHEHSGPKKGPIQHEHVIDPGAFRAAIDRIKAMEHVSPDGEVQPVDTPSPTPETARVPVS